MKEKINLDEKIVLFNQTMTREEAIIELANHYLPFFQAHNIHHGINEIRKPNIAAHDCSTYMHHHANALKMNEIISQIKLGKNVTFKPEFLAADQI